MPHVEVLVAKAHDYTFPSDHAVVAGTVIAGMWLVSKRLAWIATVVGLVLGFARVYVGAHYPSDVVAGLLLGAAICLVLAKPMTRLIKFFVSAIVKTPLRPLVIAKRD
jgi:undecaprenyl-diphosphatase